MDYFMLRNTASYAESLSVSWLSRAPSLRHNMSVLAMIESGLSPDCSEMFNRDYSNWIMREKSTYVEKHSYTKEKVHLSFGTTGPCLLDSVTAIIYLFNFLIV